MYQRYQPGQKNQHIKHGKPTVGEMQKMQNRQRGCETASKMPVSVPKQSAQNRKEQSIKTDREKGKKSIAQWIPSGVYNAETKKILGMFSAEDLLLVALIILLLDSQEKEDSLLVYLLLYILISDYVTLPI